MRFARPLLVTATLLAAACSPSEPPAPSPAPAAAETSSAENPPAAPGLVRWHPRVAAAQEAARASGKPLLVFQLLGRIDDEYC
jgi:hypothetical protein